MGVRTPLNKLRAEDRDAVLDASDQQLTDRARSGDDAAFGELYRRHRSAAEATARCLLRSRNDTDDVVADAFAGVLQALRNGCGPRDNFRTYLLACVRNGCRSWGRTVPIEPGNSSLEPRDADVDAVVLEDPERYVEASVVAKAFAGLAPRWQEMLWATAVEQQTPREAGQRMGLGSNASSQLAHRARDAFATAYLAEHLTTTVDNDCERVVPHLAAYVRGQLAPGRVAMVDQHLADCSSCSHAVVDLRDVNTTLRSLAPPAVLALLVNRTATPLATTTAGSAAAAGGMFLKALVPLLIVAPVLLADSDGFEGGTARELRAPEQALEIAPQAPEVPDRVPPELEPAAAAPPAAAPPADPDPEPNAGPPPGDFAVELEPLDVGAPDPAPAAPVVVREDGDGGDAAAVRDGDGAALGPGSTDGGESPAGDGSEPAAPPGLLASAGVGDLVGLLGIPALSDTVVAADVLIHDATRDLAAPLVDSLAGALPGNTTALLPDLPGVVLTGSEEADADTAQSSNAERPGTGGSPSTAAPGAAGQQPAVTTPPAPVTTPAPPVTTPAPAPPPTTLPGGGGEPALCLPTIDLGVVAVEAPLLGCDG